MTEKRMFAADTHEAAMAAAAVLISATRGAGAGLKVAMAALGTAPSGGFLWVAAVEGTPEQLAYLDSADLRQVGAAMQTGAGLSVWSAEGFNAGGAANG